MANLWFFVCLPAAILWIALLLLPWRPWSTRERLAALATKPGRISGLGDLTVLIPARNEAAGIGVTLNALYRQDPAIKIILIDDRSADGTAEVARLGGAPNVQVIEGTPLPSGWTGKLWALAQGMRRVDTEYVVLLDADIELEEGILARMLELARARDLQLVSLMATPSLSGFWEKLLMPAFVYFFKLLYPFHLANSSSRWVAAAAGGCVLAEAEVLRDIGGFESLKGELIDDCALAARVKGAGHRTWIGLSHSVTSHRRYQTLRPVWDMVARTAFTQLRYSPALLVGCVLAMLVAFWLPVAGLLAPAPSAQIVAAVALLAMMVSCLPTLLYYRLSPAWALLLPLVGTLYLAMTVDSARRYYRGVRSEWRGRVYATPSDAAGFRGSTPLVPAEIQIVSNPDPDSEPDLPPPVRPRGP